MPPTVHERRLAAMGTTAHIILVGGPAEIADRAARRVADLEARWSRFRPDSELCRLNAAGGGPVVLSTDTYRAVEVAVRAWRITGGRFDPTVLPALEAAGYDRSFEAVGRGVTASVAPAGRRGGGLPGPPSAPAPGCADMVLLPLLPGVVAPSRLDLGGIGKGLAADLVVTEAITAGADGACVNLGGDLRAQGRPPTDEGWVVGIEDPAAPEEDRFVVALGAGAVATSTTAKRRWEIAGEVYHHIIDPGSGRPTGSPVGSATVLAGEAWMAEALVKACLLDPAAAPALLARSGAHGLLMTEAGAVLLGRIEEFLR